MSNIRFNCPACKHPLEAPRDMAGNEIDCPACSKQITIPKQVEEKKKDWRDDPATPAQLDYLDAFNLKPDHPITKGEASELLNYAKEQNLPMVEKPRDFKQEKAQIRKEITALKKKIAQSDGKLEADEMEDLKVDLDDYESQLESLSEEEVEAKYEAADRIDGYLELFGPTGKYGSHFKKPTREHIKKALAALDRDFPGWEKRGEEPLIATLYESYPELVKGKPRQTKKKSGCLGSVAALLIIPAAFLLIILIN